MADAQIFSGDSGDGSVTYELPGTSEFTLKAVNADFQDNGAAGDWLPGVVIASDSGHVIARAVDQAVRVTAGSDAACSFFPGVKHAGAAAAGALPAFCVAGGRGTIVPSGAASETGLDFYNPATPAPNFATNDSARFTTDLWANASIPAFIGAAGVGVHKTGTYFAMFGMWMNDNPAPHFAGDPSTVQVFAEDQGDYLVAMNDVSFGSWYGNGHPELITTTRKYWRLQWAQIIVVNGSTTDAPILIGAMQSSGVNLNAHPSLYIVELDPTRLFL